MNTVIRAATAALSLTVSLTLATPASADARDWEHWDDKRVEVEGPDGEMYKLARASAEVVVDVSPEEAWELLADFGNVQDYLTSITDSDWIGEAELGNGAARYCDITFQGRDIHVKERIFAYEEGRSFTYDVYDWTNFPLKRMHNTFGVTVDGEGRTVIYNLIDYKLKPAVMTGMMRGQMRTSARASLLAVKHYLETGDATKQRDELLAMYPAS